MLRRLRMLLVATTMAMALAVIAPGMALAHHDTDCNRWPSTSDFCVVYASQAPSFTGWGRGLECNGLEPTMMGCVDMRLTAYRWTGRSWTPVRIRPGGWMWVHPYTRGWRWVWTKDTGWLALDARHIGIWMPRH